MSFGVGRRHGWDPQLLWLWCKAAATAPTGPLAWEPPYASGAALKSKKKIKINKLIKKALDFSKGNFWNGCQCDPA